MGLSLAHTPAENPPRCHSFIHATLCPSPSSTDPRTWRLSQADVCLRVHTLASCALVSAVRLHARRVLQAEHVKSSLFRVLFHRWAVGGQRDTAERTEYYYSTENSYGEDDLLLALCVQCQ